MRHLMTSVLIGLCLTSIAAAAQPAPLSANFGQVDVFGLTLESGWVCPNAQGTFFDIPGLALSLTTGGGPVMLIAQLNWRAAGTSGWQFHPVIDGVAHDEDRQSWQTGMDSELDTTAYVRVYQLPAGTHTFSTQMSCLNDVVVFRSWLTVYELPAPARR
jgi:hypothetical protein